jgi:hypothetical protein
MTIVITVYIILLIAFIIISSLLFRHAIKFGYLSPSFRVVVAVFGILSLVVIGFSIYIISLTGTPSGYEYMNTGVSSGGLNF